ncbi:MAG: type I-B CRISPR-associated protein Cas7/Cst2/DevR [Planctomycetales bacterium]|nr:type I-B CRISPR-associated protein Cas7/Cst2/DevR [Planctomycetales bacterium]
MSLHVFANIVTPFGTAANNRAETEGNITTLQKLIWHGQVHSTVSAEAIRFSLRRLLADAEQARTNRSWNEDERVNEWQDHQFSGWATDDGETFIDDDLLGYMIAEAAKTEGEAGSASVRRAVLEITRAVSLTPWSGDVTFNAASPGATPSAAKKGQNPVPYGTEVHATRYQFGLAMTPERLRQPTRAAAALQAIASLRTVAGNHGRFLFDFSPESIVLRITDDPAPRLLYCFDTEDGGKSVGLNTLTRRAQSGDIHADELIIGGEVCEGPTGEALRKAGVKTLHAGVKAAVEAACEHINSRLATA